MFQPKIPSPFEFATAHQIVFGPGTIAKAGALARPLGTRALLVHGKDAGRAQPLIDSFDQAGIDCSTFSVVGEPDLNLVTRGASEARESGAQFVVGFGGGSAIDAAKAIAALATNHEPILTYLEVIGEGKPLTAPPLPSIAVPTTAGTGAEVTRNSVLYAPEQKVKVSLRHRLLLPQLALIDPELTLGLPLAITAATGLDALTQLIEPFVSPRATPMTDPLCLDGLARVGRSFLLACREPGNLSARADMSLASLYSGIALANAALGAVHGFAAPFGGMFKAPHGAVCAALLPAVIEVNVRALRARDKMAREPVPMLRLSESESPRAETLHSATLQRYATAAAALLHQPNAQPEDLLDYVRGLCQETKISPLSGYGLTPSDFPALVQKAAQASSMKGNPVQLTEGELTEILEKSVK